MDTQANLKKWIAALRSGKYKKTVRTLHNVDEYTFCVLGVGCDVLGTRWNSSTPLDLEWESYCDNEVAGKFGLSKDIFTTLVKMNDGDLKSFSEMADFLSTFLKEEPEMANTKFDFVPGDVVEFEYNGKQRRVELDQIDKRGSHLTFSGNDYLVGDTENYRRFDLSKVKNLRKAVVNDPIFVDQVNIDKKKVESLEDAVNSLINTFGLPKYPTDKWGRVLYNLGVLEMALDNAHRSIKDYLS